MALSTEARKQLLALNLPQSNQVRKVLQEYLERTGLTVADFAARINYSVQALSSFMQGRYEKVAASDLQLRKAILDFVESHPVTVDEQIEGRLYDTENVRLLRKYFAEALERGWAYYVEGAPGTQKSFVLRHLVAELNRTEIAKNGHGRRAYYVYCPQSVRPTQLMKRIAVACGSLTGGDTQRIIGNIRFDLRARRVLLVFDEAQHLDVACLETIRELHDLPPHFGLLFAGSHQLERMFTTNALQLEQWNSRFHAGRALPGLSEDEAAEIIRGELGAKASSKVVARLIKDSRRAALSSKGEREYISARLLFRTLEGLKDEDSPSRQLADSASA